jgi:hypothetical protein
VAVCLLCDQLDSYRSDVWRLAVHVRLLNEHIDQHRPSAEVGSSPCTDLGEMACRVSSKGLAGQSICYHCTASNLHLTANFHWQMSVKLCRAVQRSAELLLGLGMPIGPDGTGVRCSAKLWLRIKLFVDCVCSERFIPVRGKEMMNIDRPLSATTVEAPSMQSELFQADIYPSTAQLNPFCFHARRVAD